MQDQTNFFTKHGAALLAQRIVAYWAARGFRVSVERFLVEGTNATWGVRSNMLNGLPRGAK